jgi:CDP-diacylglycerol--glycerol-3-phosphate 3-phosphatidyltransferase
MATSSGEESVAPRSPVASNPAPPLSRHALSGAAEGDTSADGAAAGPASGPAFEPRPVAEDFWNLPNTITTGRAAVVPLMLLLPWFPGETGSAVMAWLFIAAAVSDIFDGWLARRGQMVTHIGKLLDPLADKLLVATSLIVLLSVGRIPNWAVWMVVVIVGRELAVTGLRGIASAGGQVVGASGLGKLKTVTQNIAIGALLFHFDTFGLPAHAIGLLFLAIATGLTITSGYAYFAEYFRGLPAPGEAPEPPAAGAAPDGSDRP